MEETAATTRANLGEMLVANYGNFRTRKACTSRLNSTPVEQLGYKSSLAIVSEHSKSRKSPEPSIFWPIVFKILPKHEVGDQGMWIVGKGRARDKTQPVLDGSGLFHCTLPVDKKDLAVS